MSEEEESSSSNLPTGDIRRSESPEIPSPPQSASTSPAGATSESNAEVHRCNRYASCCPSRQMNETRESSFSDQPNPAQPTPSSGLPTSAVSHSMNTGRFHFSVSLSTTPSSETGSDGVDRAGLPSSRQETNPETPRCNDPSTESPHCSSSFQVSSSPRGHVFSMVLTPIRNAQNLTATSTHHDNQLNREVAPGQSSRQDQEDASHREQCCSARTLDEFRRLLPNLQQRFQQQQPEQHPPAQGNPPQQREHRRQDAPPPQIRQRTTLVLQNRGERRDDAPGGQQPQAEGEQHPEQGQQNSAQRPRQGTEQTARQWQPRAFLVFENPRGQRGNRQGMRQLQQVRGEPTRIQSQVLTALQGHGIATEHQSARGLDIYMLSLNRLHPSRNGHTLGRALRLSMARRHPYLVPEQGRFPSDDINQSRQHQWPAYTYTLPPPPPLYSPYHPEPNITDIIRRNTVVYRYQQRDSVHCGSASPSEFCVICMAELLNNQHVRRLPCFHVFHEGCIDRWLGNRADCPVCRNDIRSHPDGSLRFATDVEYEPRNDEEQNNDSSSLDSHEEPTTYEEPVSANAGGPTSYEVSVSENMAEAVVYEEPMPGNNDEVMTNEERILEGNGDAVTYEEQMLGGNETVNNEELNPGGNETRQRIGTGDGGLQFQIFASNVTIQFTDEQ